MNSSVAGFTHYLLRWAFLLVISSSWGGGLRTNLQGPVPVVGLFFHLDYKLVPVYQLARWCQFQICQLGT